MLTEIPTKPLPFNPTFKPDTFDLVIIKGVINRWTFSLIAKNCMKADEERKKRGTSFVQSRLRRLIDNGYAFQDPEDRGTTGSYLLTPEALKIMAAYNVKPNVNLPVIERV